MTQRLLHGRQGLRPAKPDLGELPDVGLGELLVGEVRQGRPTPQLACPAQHLLRLSEVAGLEPSRPFAHEPLDPASVDRVGVDHQHVAWRPPDDDVPADQRLERPSELGDIDLDRVGGQPGRPIAPHEVNQTIDRDDLVRVEEQDREERTLLRGPEIGERPIRGDLECAQDPIVHHRPHSVDPAVARS